MYDPFNYRSDTSQYTTIQNTRYLALWDLESTFTPPWRRMLLRQPPLTKVKLFIRSRDCKGPGRQMRRVVTRAEGVRYEDLFREGESMLGVGKSRAGEIRFSEIE